MQGFTMPEIEGARLRGCRGDDGRAPLAAYAFPGGYPLVYIDGDGACLCPGCANETDSEHHNSAPDDGLLDAPVVSYFANFEDVIYCDGCGAVQMGAYVEEEAEEYIPIQ